MLDGKGQVLYVGKAKNLKKRVTSYFKRQLDAKTLQLIKQVQSIEVTITRNEREALLLESNLIKAEKPRYNVLFRDDKSYPYLKLSEEPFPQLSFHRGFKRGKDRLYGPYASAREARDALTLLQNIFHLRICAPSFFKARTRPCLQYQIKRCSGPCVGLISEEDYARDVAHARLFLEGKNRIVIEELIQKMSEASEALAFEKAGKIRDQIALLRGIQEQQIIVGNSDDIDVLGIYVAEGEACIQKLMIRDGQMLGSRQYFPNKNALIMPDEKIDETFLEAFLLQHYGLAADKNISLPKIIIVPFLLSASEAVISFIQAENGQALQLVKAVRGDRLRWVDMATISAREALVNRLLRQVDLSTHLEALKKDLGFTRALKRIQCFDVSHSLGEATVVSCVTFGAKGAIKSAYRRFNIRAKTGGNDIAALHEGLTRHFGRLKTECAVMPDVLIIDGGKGQLSVARKILSELGILDVALLAVAKGEGRKSGLETVYRWDGARIQKIMLDPLSFQLILKCRDEAHRFAITAHRNQRGKRLKTSSLEKISGIGHQRRQNLLHYFGGLQEIEEASVEELAKVPGINDSLALRLYQALHGN